MKTFSVFLTALLVISVRLMADESQLPHITVFGTAVTEVVPDEMVWSLEVRNVQASLEGAATEHAKSVKEVLGFLKELKIDDKHIQTSQMEFGENKEYKSDSWVKSGYYAKTDISFKLTDFALYKKIWGGLAKIPGVSVQSTSYDDSKRIEHRKETRRKALESAKEKASEMAKTLGSEIQEPLLVEEDLSIYQWWQGNTAVQSLNSLQAVGNANALEEGQLALGTIPIRARVKVSFRLLTTQK